MGSPSIPEELWLWIENIVRYCSRLAAAYAGCAAHRPSKHMDAAASRPTHRQQVDFITPKLFAAKPSLLRIRSVQLFRHSKSIFSIIDTYYCSARRDKSRGFPTFQTKDLTLYLFYIIVYIKLHYFLSYTLSHYLSDRNRATLLLPCLPSPCPGEASVFAQETMTNEGSDCPSIVLGR